MLGVMGLQTQVQVGLSQTQTPISPVEEIIHMERTTTSMPGQMLRILEMRM